MLLNIICCSCWVTSVVSDSVRPHRRQPTRMPRPWDSPGKNIGVGCHLFLQCMNVKSESEVAQLWTILSDPMDCSLPGSSGHGISQARILELVTISFSRGSSWHRNQTHISRVGGRFLPLSHLGSHVYPAAAAAAAAKSLQSCPTLCDPIDGSPAGSPVPGILQPRTLEWVAISFSNAWKWKVKVKSLSRVWLLATSWTAAYQAPPSMGFSRQEYWSGVPLPSP